MVAQQGNNVDKERTLAQKLVLFAHRWRCSD